MTEKFPVGATQLPTILGLIATPGGTEIPIPSGYRKFAIYVSPTVGVTVVREAGETTGVLGVDPTFTEGFGIFAAGTRLFAYAAAPTVIDAITPFGWETGELYPHAPVGGPSFVAPTPAAGSIAQTIRVAVSGGDFTSVKDACDSILDSSPLKPYLILVYPGLYVEDPFVVPQHTSISGAGDQGTPIIVANNQNATLCTLSDYSSLNRLTFRGPTNKESVVVSGGNFAELDFITLIGSQTGLAVQGSGSQVFVIDCKAFSITGTAFDCSDKSIFNSSETFASGCGVGFHVRDDSSNMWLSNCGIENCTIGLYGGDGTNPDCDLYTYNVSITDCTTGIRAEGTAVQITGGLIHCRGTATLDLEQVTAGAQVYISGARLRRELISVQDWSDLQLHYDSEDEAGKGVSFSQDVHVGEPELGHVSTFGEGTHYVRGMVVVTTDATAGPGADGGAFADVSDLARSSSGSTFSFQGTAAGHAIYFGSSLVADGSVLKHWDLILKQTTAAVEVTAKSFIWEIWNGVSWTEIGVMAIQPDSVFRYANEVFLRAPTTEEILYGIDNLTTWVTKTIDGNDLYWMRVRITANLTTAPVFEQALLGSSHAQNNIDGFAIYEGNSRYLANLVQSSNTWGESGGIVDGAIDVGSGAAPTGWAHDYVNSEFNGDGDAIYFQLPIPRGVDTSLPLQIRMGYILDSTGTGNTTLICSVLPLEKQGVLEADPAGGIAPIPRTLANTETITGKVAQTDTQLAPNTDATRLQSVEFGPYDITDYYTGDELYIRIESDAIGGAQLVVSTVELVASRFALGDRLTS